MKLTSVSLSDEGLIVSILIKSAIFVQMDPFVKSTWLKKGKSLFLAAFLFFGLFSFSGYAVYTQLKPQEISCAFSTTFSTLHAKRISFKKLSITSTRISGNDVRPNFLYACLHYADCIHVRIRCSIKRVFSFVTKYLFIKLKIISHRPDEEFPFV
jgi:hypothetical protein